MTNLVLYNHNKKAYEKIKEAYNKGQRIVGNIQATGTGKSYIAISLILDNQDKNIYLIEPYNSIIEHLIAILASLNLSLDDLPNLNIITYKKLTMYSDEELKNMQCDLLILDEFHHIGAPLWGNAVNKFINYHEDMQIFGMSAYTIRDRNTPYERDMAAVDGFELFSNNIVNEYHLANAITDGILPNVIYKSGYVDLLKMLKQIEKYLNKSYFAELKTKYNATIKKIKEQVINTNIVKELIQKNIYPGSKWIYFCPNNTFDNQNNLINIKDEIITYLKEVYNEEDIVIYMSTSLMGKEGKKNREAFYNDVNLAGNDVSHKIRIMFTINQYNEGVHVPNVDGVIMGRETKSDIVFFEQLGRALCVNGNITSSKDALNKCTLDELRDQILKRDILLPENYNKEDIISMLLSPTIIDLAGNISFIEELQNNIINLLNKKPSKKSNKEYIHHAKNDNLYTNIEIINIDLFKTLKEINKQIKLTWYDYYELAINFYQTYQNLRIKRSFKTFDGINYDANGYNLGKWIDLQRSNYKELMEGKSIKISEEQINLLNKIGMLWQVYDYTWDMMFQKAKEYYQENGNLEVKSSYVTKEGLKLGIWLYNQRHSYNYSLKNNPKRLGTNVMTEERINALNSIGMIWDMNDYKWQKNLQLVTKYKEYYGNLNIPFNFKTFDGINYDENGIYIGIWLCNQKSALKDYMNNTKRKSLLMNEERKQLLLNLGINNLEFNNKFNEWLETYEVAKEYYELHGNLDIPYNYVTINNVKLGHWLGNQKYWFNQYLKNNKKMSNSFTEEKKNLLDDIGIIWNKQDNFVANVKLFTENNISYDYAYINLYNYANFDLERKLVLLKEYMIDLNSENLLYYMNLSYNKLKECLKAKTLKRNL